MFQQPEANTKRPTSAIVRHTNEALTYMTGLGLNPKQFMITFWSSDNKSIAYRRCQMKNGQGGGKTKTLLKHIGINMKHSTEGQANWESFILEEASAIVNSQEVARGVYPAGAYVSSKHITPDFFSKSSEDHRTMQIKEGMPFLHALISQKISGGIQIPDLTQYNDDNVITSNGLNATSAPLDTLEAEDEANEDAVLSLANLVHIKLTPTEVTAHKAAMLPVAICSMIAFACNRRSNASALQNGLMLMAGAMDSLRILQENRIMEVFKVNRKMMPLLCFDNVDIQLRIHNTRIDTSSKMFHGTWGFYIVVRACLLAKCEAEAVNLAAFLAAMKAANKKAVNIETFRPTPSESKHFKKVIKCQLAKALKEHIHHLPNAPEEKNLPALMLRPPQIDRIEFHTPNIHFLRMMDAPDSSAEGVSRVFDAIMSQIGLSKEDYAKSLLVAGGDVGSNQLVESLRVKLYGRYTGGIPMTARIVGPGDRHLNWEVIIPSRLHPKTLILL
ncbi:uncharacterized protein MELLADRAFT_86615 [Melampsora larici-populina 98AG31]|uniref:DUF6589 domain-containing protein n=1 Tax=Melampsora larici-populina (strain 98AG31 / pathotype 3-4-7) TaxID=747676 RepID=F4RMF6_MELLP|nr:uncharacterized protein MELLADRAFT_86615 [Melampsora larici-populina 98AG31]EGG06483.1 hypothetical protein MELLADRAFT_86615 [Melampsora larici-populina 98AG31]